MVNMAKLERVIGCTAASRCSISVDENKGIIAYPAGSTVVIHNPRNNAQAHLIGTTKNTITCLSFSSCGKYVATGECGHEPRIRVWELYDASGQFAFSQVADIKYHQLGIVCVRFTAGGTQVMSVGNQHDKAIAIHDWRKQQTIAENRLTCRVNSMDENEQGTYVTVGVRHVKFWHVTGKVDSSRSLPLQGRSAILADHRNNTFVDVCCAPNNKTFSITETKMLVEFNDKKLVNTYDLNGETPYSMALGIGELFIGFNNGTVRCFDVESVTHKRTYCKPHYLLCDVAKGTSGDALLPTSHPANARYPDVRALCYNKKSGVMTAVYSDRSIYSWQQLAEGGAITKLSSQLFHVGAIFALEIYPSAYSFLPAGTFITCGADETVRIWNVDQRTKRFDQECTSPLPQTNVYSEELKKAIYLTDANSSLIEMPDKVLAPSSMDLTTGAKSLRISPDGQHLACGGRDGNLRIYDLTLPDTPMIAIYEAHEAEIMCLEYSDPQRSERYLLASGSRDRLVHLFDPRNGYLPLASVDDHTSTVNSIVFTSYADEFFLISCASDKVVVLRRMVESKPTEVRFERTNQVTSQFGLNNMVMSADGILAACQDRQLRTYSLQGKLVKQVRGATTDDGQLTKVRLDPSGTFAATVCSDRNVYVVEASTGECAAILSGQSDSVTDVAFSHDCRRLIVVSYSGCIFVWRLSNLLASKMNDRLKRMSASVVQVAATVGKANDRAETPDSLIGSGSDAASEEHRLVANKAKDSESEFGSLNSVRIADEDDDSCIGQKPAKVVVSQSAEDPHNFELKRTATEVVRRSNSGLLSQQNSAWDIASAANDFSDDESAGVPRLGVEASLGRAGTSNTYTASRSMSNLRPAPAVAHPSGGSPRRPRKKWDMSGDAAGYASPLALQQQQQQAAIYGAYNGSPATNPPLPSGFMTMNGTHIYHSPSVVNRPAVDEMSSSVSMPGINQAARPQPSVVQSSSKGALGNLQTMGMVQGSGYMPPKPADLPLQQTLPGERKLSVPSHQLSPGDATFARTSPQRCSLTKRFMLSTPGATEPRTVWTPPAISTRRSASSMQYSTPQAGGASALIRRQDDYATSDLHLRSRSQSPSQLALNALGDDYLHRAHRQDSDMSVYSTVTMTSSRLTPASSRSNLRTIGTTNRQSSQAINKLNEMRDKLRKSQENLAGAIGDEAAGASTSLLMSRSRSIGNLRFSAALPVSGQRSDLASANYVAASTFPHDGSHMPGADSENKNDSSTLLSARSRYVARSVGNLHNNQDAADSAEDSSSTAHPYPPPRAPRRLAQTIESLKKASNPDLTQLVIGEDSIHAAGDLDTEAYYSSASLPRNQRGKGAVQKRVERYHPHSRVSRDTTSGESDSNASDANNSPLLQGAGIGGSQNVAKRYFSTVNGPNRSVSSMEGMPRPGMLQNARRIFEQQRHSSSNVPRRAPNYLAQKLAGGDIVGPDMGAEECPRQPVSPNEAATLPDFDTKSPQSKQMARHVAECLKQFNTGLDMILQARQLLESSQHLPSDDRETMLRILNQGIRTGRKRLDVTDDRYEPDGGRSDSPNSISSQRPNATHPSPGGDHPQQMTSTALAGDIDPAVFFQQHGHQLLALLQQNMAKQN